MVYHLWEILTMLEYNQIPTNKSQHKEGVQTTFIKRVRNKNIKTYLMRLNNLKEI